MEINHRDRATYVSYALGLAMLNSLGVMMHELKTGDKRDQKLYKEKINDKVKLHQAVNNMFPNAKKYLDNKDIEKLTDAINALVDGLWV